MNKHYFPHDMHAREDSKLAELQQQGGAAWYGMFWMVTELLYENSGCFEYNEAKIAYLLRLDKHELSLCLSLCLANGLLKLEQSENSKLLVSKRSIEYCKKIESRVEQLREAGRKGGQAKLPKTKGKQAQAKHKLKPNQAQAKAKPKLSYLILSNLILSNLDLSLDISKQKLLQDYQDYRIELWNSDKKKQSVWKTERGFRSFIKRVDSGKAGLNKNVGWHNFQEALEISMSHGWMDLGDPTKGQQQPKSFQQQERDLKKEESKKILDAWGITEEEAQQYIKTGEIKR